MTTATDTITRGAINLGNLDAHGLSLLREILLDAFDDGCTCASYKHRWELFEGIVDEDGEEVTEAQANEQRLLFCDEVQKQIARATMPEAVKEAK